MPSPFKRKLAAPSGGAGLGDQVQTMRLYYAAFLREKLAALRGDSQGGATPPVARTASPSDLSAGEDPIFGAS